MDEEGADEQITEESAMIYSGPNDRGFVVENVKIEGTGAGTAIRSDGEGATAASVDVSGFERGVVNRGTIGVENSSFTNVDFGYTGHAGSTAVIDQSRFESNIADILYHDDAQLLIYHSIATHIMKLTEGTPTRIDPAYIDSGEEGGPPIDEPHLYHIARAIVLSNTSSKKEEHVQDLLDILRDGKVNLVDSISTASDLVTVGEALKGLFLLAYNSLK